MSSDVSPEQENKRQIGGELIIPIAALGFTLYYFSTIIDSPWTAQVNAFMVGSILIFVVLLFFGVATREVIAGRATLGASNLLAPYAILPKRVAFIGLAVFYLIAIQWLGFTLTTFAFLGASMILLDNARRPLLCTGIAAIMAAIAYVVFIALFETRLPKGPIEHLLAGLV